MINIQLQDLTAIINGTSKYNGGKYDTVHVEILLVTNEPIPQELSWYVPAGVSVPPEVQDILKVANLPMYPLSADKLLLGIDDVRQQAEQGNLTDVINDSARLLQLSIMKKMTLTPVAGSTNTYTLSYDYKIFPLSNNPNSYEFKALLPFDGLNLVAGSGKVYLTVITPTDSIIDQANTKGIDVSGLELTELISPIGNTRRQIVSFEYHTDPEFIIRYNY